MKLALREGASFCTSWSATPSLPPTFGCSVRGSISIDLSSERLRSPNRSSFTTSLELVSFQSQTYLFWYLFLSIIYFFIGIGQWSTSYYKTTFSYIRHVLVFVYLIFNMFSKLPFLPSSIERNINLKWYRPFLDYIILNSFKREFCIKISKKIQIVKLNDLDFFFFLPKDSLLRETSVFKFVGRSGMQFVDHQASEGFLTPRDFYLL